MPSLPLHMYGMGAQGSGGYLRFKYNNEIRQNSITNQPDAELWFDTVSGGHYFIEFNFRYNGNDDAGGTSHSRWALYHTGDTTTFWLINNGTIDRAHPTASSTVGMNSRGRAWSAALLTTDVPMYPASVDGDSDQLPPYFWHMTAMGMLQVGASGGKFGMTWRPNDTVATVGDKGWCFDRSYIYYQKMN